MSSFNDLSAKLAFSLLKVILPKSVNEDISGDLHEEFTQMQSTAPQSLTALSWLWHQTLSCTWRLIMTKQRFYSLMLALFCSLIMLVLIIAINFLSIADASEFQQDFWTNGHIHQLFLQPTLWASINDGLLDSFNWNMLMDVNSFIYAVLCFLLLSLLDKKYHFSSTAFALISLIGVILPYTGGFIYFQVQTVALNQSGPVIALMWLSILYLLPLLTYKIIAKRHRLTIA